MIVILGPTASGKTSGAIELAKKMGGAVISADSRQLYAGMDIGTAPPLRPANTAGFAGQEPHDIFTPDYVDSVAHYGLNIREPNDQMTLAQWQPAAFNMIDYIMADGKVPLLVGGTGLYIDSVVDNYDIPTVVPNEQSRSKLE